MGTCDENLSPLKVVRLIHIATTLGLKITTAGQGTDGKPRWRAEWLFNRQPSCSPPRWATTEELEAWLNKLAVQNVADTVEKFGEPFRPGQNGMTHKMIALSLLLAKAGYCWTHDFPRNTWGIAKSPSDSQTRPDAILHEGLSPDAAADAAESLLARILEAHSAQPVVAGEQNGRPLLAAGAEAVRPLAAALDLVVVQRTPQNIDDPLKFDVFHSLWSAENPGEAVAMGLTELQLVKWTANRAADSVEKFGESKKNPDKAKRLANELAVEARRYAQELENL